MSNDFDFISSTIEVDVFELSKIVTYKSLSEDCSIPVNRAKSGLQKFVDRNKDRVKWTYIIGGFKTIPQLSHLSSKSDSVNCQFQYILVPSSELENSKRLFSQITTVHIYSVQKGSLSSHIELCNHHQIRHSQKILVKEEMESQELDEPKPPQLVSQKELEEYAFLSNTKSQIITKFSPSQEPDETEKVKTHTDNTLLLPKKEKIDDESLHSEEMVTTEKKNQTKIPHKTSSKPNTLLSLFEQKPKTESNTHENQENVEESSDNGHNNKDNKDKTQKDTPSKKTNSSKGSKGTLLSFFQSKEGNSKPPSKKHKPN